MTSERGANTPGTTGAGQDLASLLGRFVAVFIDWAACTVLAIGLNWLDLVTADPFGQAVLRALLFAAYYAVALAFGTQTLGMRLMRIACVSADHGGPIGFPRALVRAVLLSLLIPALTALVHPYHRGLHDLAAGSVMLQVPAPAEKTRPGGR
ncbi:RDD family protein [Glycomyces sp. TRM65418]|uniref:RDD family protein n=1 Tax=Glycomyces sp. TRM65418 TaxID=2867006 RepID=UPI001CE69DC8|nr:RDD family protein [Glycomyces sp. TRM65418]MCC3762123.1 RDD family protein [Glycomyces sp. TRM65418]QZD56188.1 RDD family protein [Glycomyces sp. TRM65418]